MFKKLFVLIVAASALGACADPRASSPPTAPSQPAPAPVSYMVFFELGGTKLGDQDPADGQPGGPGLQNQGQCECRGGRLRRHGGQRRHEHPAVPIAAPTWSGTA